MLPCSHQNLPSSLRPIHRKVASSLGVTILVLGSAWNPSEAATVYKTSTPELSPSDPQAWYGTGGLGDMVEFQSGDLIEFGIHAEGTSEFTIYSEMEIEGLRFTSELSQPIAIQSYANVQLGASGIWIQDQGPKVSLNSDITLMAAQTWEANLLQSGLWIGGNIQGDAATPLTLNGKFDGNHNVGLNPALAELHNGTGNRAFIFSGATSNSYLGSTIVNNGILALNKSQGAIAIQGNLQANGSSAVFLMGDRQIQSTSTLTLTGGAKYIINGYAQTLGGLIGSGTTSLVESVSSGGEQSLLSLNVAADQTYHFNGGILRNGGSGVLQVSKSGLGTQMVTGSMQFTGGLSVEEGSFVIRATGANIYNASHYTLTDWKSAISVATGATLVLEHVQSTNTIEQLKVAVSGGGTLEKAGLGTIRVTSDNSQHTGLVHIRNGVLEVTGGKAIRDENTVELSNVTTAALSLIQHETIGGLSGGGSTGGHVQLQNQNLTLQRSSGNLTYQGVMSGTGNLIKTGLGEQLLSGTNTFTGTTTIQQGTLSVSGGNAIANSATVRVEAHASAVFKLQANEAIRQLEGGSSSGGSVDTGTFALTVQEGTFAGLITGVDRGAGDPVNTHKFSSLIKTGNGTLYLTGTQNTYRGFTELHAGILNVAQLSNVGQAGSLGQRMVENTVSDVGLIFRGGTLQYTGATAQSTDRAVRIDINGGAFIDASGSHHNATVSFTRAASPDFFVSSGSRQLTLTGTNQGNNTWNMAIAQTGSTTTLNKTGNGHWRLTGTHAYTGATQIQAGALLVNGTLGNTATTVAVGAKLAGTGTLGGLTTVLGQLSPGGDSSLTSSNFSSGFGLGTLKFSSAARLAFEGASSSLFVQLASAGLSDRIHLDATSGTSLTLGVDTRLDGTFTGHLQTDVLNAASDSTYSKYWIGVLASGASSAGTFANAELQNLNFWAALLGSGLTSDWNQAHHLRFGAQDFALFYHANFDTQSFTGGNDLLMIAIAPEPRKSLLIASAILALSLKRRRRK